MAAQSVSFEPEKPALSGMHDRTSEDSAQAAAANGDPQTLTQSEREIAEIEASDPRLIALDERLTRIAKGEEPRDNAERLALAKRAYDTKRYAAAVSLWSKAFDSEPNLADDRQTPHRYNAACAAALAGCGKGIDDPSPDDTTKEKFRGKVREWLKADLVSLSKIVDAPSPRGRSAVNRTLQHWRQDPDLAGIRDQQELAKLPETERKEWQSLWVEIEAQRKRAEVPAR